MKSITIIVPALNEEKNLQKAVKDICQQAEKHGLDYEIIIFDDCSQDKTPEIAEQLAKENPRIKVTHNKTTKGLSYNYKKGIQLASKEYVIMLPGDGENTLEGLIEYIGEADIIIPYVLNPEVRPWIRRVISKTFTFLVNLLGGLNLKYYNGTVIHKTEIVRKIAPLVNDGFGYQAEILTRLIKSGADYKEIGINIQKKQNNTTKAFTLKNFIRVAKTLFRIAKINDNRRV